MIFNAFFGYMWTFRRTPNRYDLRFSSSKCFVVSLPIKNKLRYSMISQGRQPFLNSNYIVVGPFEPDSEGRYEYYANVLSCSNQYKSIFFFCIRCCFNIFRFLFCFQVTRKVCRLVRLDVIYYEYRRP